MPPSSINSGFARRPSVRIAALLSGLLMAGALALADSAEAATGTVHTSGAPLTVRATASASAKAVGSVATGSTITIDCQTTGTKVTGKYGTSSVWDHVPAKHGYVSDTYVYTGSDGRVAPTCGSTTTSACSTAGTGDPKTCAQAVAWAKAHETTSYHSDYYRRCDHIMGLAYGWSASGSTTAYVHWTQIPSQYKHSGSTNVPAGALAFFSGGAGHVMISIGGGKFVSNDIHGNGTLTVTTISEIKSKWGKPYLGWAQPWFKVNH